MRPIYVGRHSSGNQSYVSLRLNNNGDHDISVKGVLTNTEAVIGSGDKAEFRG